VSGVERVLAEVTKETDEYGYGHRNNPWDAYDLIQQATIRAGVWYLSAIRGNRTARANLRPILVEIAARCVAAIAALDAPAGSEARR